jgi:hypothetical protein
VRVRHCSTRRHVIANDQDVSPRKGNAPDEFHSESESEVGSRRHRTRGTSCRLQYKDKEPLRSDFHVFKSCLRSVIQEPDARDSEIPFRPSRRFPIAVNRLAGHGTRFHPMRASYHGLQDLPMDFSSSTTDNLPHTRHRLQREMFLRAKLIWFV